MHKGTEKARSKTGEQLVAELDAMTRLHKLAMLSVSEAGLEPILGEIVDAAIAVSGADFGSIQVLDPVSSDLGIVSHRGLPQWWLDFWQNVPRGQSGCGAALERGERVIVEDVEQSPLFAGTRGLEMLLKAGVRAQQSTPLLSRSGKPLGVFSTHYKKPHRPDERTLQLLDLLARQAADVIEHTQVTSALRHSEERYRLLAEQVTDGIFVIDSHGRYLDANRAGCEMLGYKLEELLALSVPDVLVPDELQKLPGQFAHLATGRTAQNEWRFIRKDGSVFIGELVSRQFPDGRLNGIVRDVTERKRAEAEAQAIVEAAPVAIFFARDPQCLEIIGNRMAHKLLRLPPGSNLSMSAPEGQRPDFRIMRNGTEIPLHELPMQKAAATGKAVYGSEIDFVYHDGRCCSLIGNAVPIFGSDGRPQGSIGVFLDITERKRMDEALRVSEERFRVALKNSPVVVFSQDHQLRYTWINSPVLGWAVQGYIGQTDAEIVGGKEGDRLMAIKRGVLQSGIGTRAETTVTFQGETHYFDLTVEPLRDAFGVIVGVTCSAADITPLKQVALELERLNQLKTEFLGMAAHDLRAPIGRILSLARFLFDEVATALTEEQLGFLSDIRNSSQFTLQLIDDFLELSSIESGNFHLDLRRSDPRQLLEHNVGLNAELAQRKYIHVGLQIEGALPELSIDKAKIEQVLNNLISNAVKFSQPGTAVEVSARAQDGNVLISVRDQGPGIPEAERDKLFQSFCRTSVRSIATERSTGLGLAIARKIVEEHGGHIWVESQVGVGSTFLFTLPA
jgi:PAS domain S-box-containing protein